MTNRHKDAAPVTGSDLREIWALKQAVELLGFDADALVRRMCESSGFFWQRLALRSTTVRFDPTRARCLDPSIPSAGLTVAGAWLASVRSAPGPTAAATMELVSLDDGYDPPRTVANTRDLIGRGVFALG